MATLPVGDDWQKGNEEDLTEIHNCYCPNCANGNGTTLLLPTKIPGFREIIIATLTCPDCGFRNSEVSFGGEIQPQGQILTLTIQNSNDLNRQVLKSDSTTLKLPTLNDLEIPSNTQKGVITTVEGILARTKENLSTLQQERLLFGDLDNFRRCQDVIDKVKRIIYDGQDDDEERCSDREDPVFPFDVILDDPAGNAFVENPFFPDPDPQLTFVHYDRTPTQDMQLGLQPSKEAIHQGTIDDDNPKHKSIVNDSSRYEVYMDDARTDIGRQESLLFPTTCSNCYRPAETKMCVTDIPHFKECIIMSLVCDHCGYKSNEIKGGGAIPKYGSKIVLSVTSEDDLLREILKSDTAGMEIPELELKLDEGGGAGGLYTTAEGLLKKTRETLEVSNPFGCGDSAVKQHISNDGGDFSLPNPNHTRYLSLLDKIKDMALGRAFPFTLVLCDPLGNSFIGPVPKDAIRLGLQAEKEGSKACYETYVDSGMTIHEFKRTHQQNEMLGLNDIKTEGYGHGEYYGTDQMQDVPDRIKRRDIRGPDHPHLVAKAPVERDNTAMGPKGANFSFPL